jgi:hypothetical protein
MIPYILLIAGFFFFTEDPMNRMMSVILAAATLMGLFWWVEQHSSFWVALGTIGILMMAGIGMIALILIRSGGDDDYCYD